MWIYRTWVIETAIISSVGDKPLIAIRKDKELLQMSPFVLMHTEYSGMLRGYFEVSEILHLRHSCVGKRGNCPFLTLNFKLNDVMNFIPISKNYFLLEIDHLNSQN